jgi:chromosome segregation ATPase
VWNYNNKMNSKDEPESKFIQFQDNNYRLVRDLKSQNEALFKEYTKSQEKLSKHKDSLSRLQTVNSNIEKELILSKSNAKKLLLQKQGLEKELQDLKDYSRKLEQKLTMGGKGQGLAEANMLLQQKMSEIRTEKTAAVNKNQDLEREIENLRLTVQNLTFACAQKAEDLGIKDKGGQDLVVSLAGSMQKIHSLKQNYEELKEKYEKVVIKNEELQIIRESNNEELNRLEEEAYLLKEENEKLLKENKEIGLDRTALLQCLEEMTAQQQQYEMDIERFSKEIEANSLAFEAKITELTKENELKDQIIKAKTEKKYFIAGPASEDEIKILKTKVETLSLYEKESQNLKVELKKHIFETEEMRKNFEGREKKLKAKLSQCCKELEKLVNEKEEMQTALNEALSKCTEKLPSEERPRQTDDTLTLLSQMKQKNIDLLKMIS